jgi:hypothetical protein
MQPRIRFALKVLASLLAAIQAAAAPVDVYILTGQSNSLGTTALENDYTPGSDPADSVIRLYWANTSGTAGWPVTLIGTSVNIFKPLMMQQGGYGNPSFWGPEFGFSRTLYAAGRTNFVIIKASAAGGGNTLWDKATFDLNHTNAPMWGHLSNTVYTALSNLTASGKTFNVRGLLYVQGEGNNASEAAIAGPRFGLLYTNLFNAINTNYPGTANGMLALMGEIGASQYTYISQTTTVQQVTLAASNDAIGYIYTRDLPLKSDNLHFPKPCKLEIGRRMGNAFLGRPTIVPVSFGAVTNAPDATTLIFDRYVPDTNATVQGVNLIAPNPYTGFANGDDGQARAGLLVTGSAGQVVFANYSNSNATSDIVAGQYNFASNGLPANWVDSGTNVSFTFADPYNQAASALVSAVAFELVSPLTNNNVTVSLFDGRADVLYTSGTITNGRFGFEAHEAFAGALTSAVSRVTLQSGTNVLWSVGHPTDGGVPDFAYNGWRLPSSYERWSFQVADPAQRGYTADPDNDGALNLLEYANGTSPTNHSSTPSFVGTWSNGGFTVLFQRTNADDLTWEVQGTTGLAEPISWQSLALKQGNQPWSGPALVLETNSGSGTVAVLVRDPVSSAPQHFLRLHVSPLGPTGYDLWCLQLPNAQQRNELADPDGDGAPNLFEYATGTDPANSLSVAELEGVRTNGGFAVQFPRADVDDVTWQVQGSTNLSGSVFWENLATKSGNMPWSGPAQVEETDQGAVKWVLVFDPDSSASQRFLRLQISRP